MLILHSGHIEVSSKGLSPDLGRRLEISYLLVFGQNQLRNNRMSDDHPVKEQVLLDYKNNDFM